MTNVSRSKEQHPDLMILASSAQGIYRRFKGWPDTYISPEVWTQLVTEPAQLAPDVRSLLEQKGILQAGTAAPYLTIPVYEQLPREQWRNQLRALALPNQSDLRAGINLLREQWNKQRLPDWNDLAHSFLVNYLLWSVGGQLLLGQYSSESSAVVVSSLADGAAVWQGFVRANQQFGVSCLLGGKYEGSLTVRDLLNKSDVLQALATLREDKTLYVASSTAGRILNRFSAVGNDRGADGSQHASWPVLEASQLRLLKANLLLATQALRLLIQQTVVPLVEAAAAGLQRYTPPDLALVAYALLIGVLVDDWTEANLLPPRIQPLLAGLV